MLKWQIIVQWEALTQYDLDMDEHLFSSLFSFWQYNFIMLLILAIIALLCQIFDLHFMADHNLECTRVTTG